MFPDQSESVLRCLIYLRIKFQVDWTLISKVIRNCLEGANFRNVRFWNSHKGLAVCKVSDKSEMVGEIIGWFDMELPILLNYSSPGQVRAAPSKLLGCASDRNYSMLLLSFLWLKAVVLHHAYYITITNRPLVGNSALSEGKVTRYLKLKELTFQHQISSICCWQYHVRNQRTRLPK